MKHLLFILALMIFTPILPTSVAQGDLAVLSRAQQAYEEERFAETIELLEQNDGTESNYEAVFLMANSYQKEETYDRAIELYNICEKLNDADVELYINRASAKIWSEDLEGAFDDLEKAESIDKNNFRLHYYLGVAHYYDYKTKPAIAALDRCIELNGQYAPAYYLRGACYGERSNQKNAIADFSKSYDLDSELTIALFHIAVIKYLNKEYYAAHSDLSQLLESDLENKAEIYYYRAECAYFTNDKQAACFDYNEAAQLGDKVSAEIYDRYCLKGENRKKLPKRNTESISL